jgi:hypothetical protein
MSAYIVNRNHIRYLVESALNIAFRDKSKSFRWYHNEEFKDLTEENATEVGQMLWDENAASVRYRYPGLKRPGAEMPGPMNENYIYYHQMAGVHYKFDVAQILKAADCYEYQSCEHPDWESSSAHAFIQSLVQRTYPKMDGYEAAEWGAPPVPKPKATVPR